MTIPILCVFIAFLLNLVSKGPVALAMAKQDGGYDNSAPRDQQARLEGWGRRAVAAQLNGFEAFPPFAIAVVLAIFTGSDPVWTARLAVLFIIARALYLPLYVLNLDLLRSAVWTVGLASTIGLFLLPFFA